MKGDYSFESLRDAFKGHKPTDPFPLYARMREFGPSYRVLSIGQKWIHVLTMQGRKKYPLSEVFGVHS